MAFLKKSSIKQYAANYINRRPQVTARSIANESEKLHYSGKTYDVFLSHSVKDAEIVIGVKAFLEEQGNSVYVDWLEDSELDRTKVTPENAEILRLRMKACSSLIFIATDNASGSKWMPWELGYFDGFRANSVAVLPVLEDWQNSFDGQEYLGLYPVIEQVAVNNKLSYVAHKKNSTRNAELGKFAKGQAIF